ncbi:MAG TPA: hypothetical protein VGJ20_46875 [Xanthobacteraceae bacterium]|jgi:hypothetical protein
MNWVVGQRVCREEAPEQTGTVRNVNRTEIQVVWDNGGISFHQLGSHVSLKDARER